MTSVSALLTCYNEAEYIEDAILSVIRQTRYDAVDRIVVVNDGSEDQSEDIILRLADKYPKIKYIYQENQGLAAARNTGLARCTGDFVAILDGDDIWLEERLERQLGFVSAHPDVGVIYSDFYLFGNSERQRVTPNKFDYSNDDTLKRLFIEGGPIVPSTTLINKQCFESVGIFDPVLRRAQDTDMWLRIAHRFPIHYIDEPLILRREREGSLGGDAEKKTKYLMYVTDKITDSFPELRPYEQRRKSMIRCGMARKLLKQGKRKEAVRMAARAVTSSVRSIEGWATFLFVLVPLPTAQLQKVLDLVRRTKYRIYRII